jgi:hypothetical protein
MTPKTILPRLRAAWIAIICLNCLSLSAETPDAVLENQQTDVFVKDGKLYTSRSYVLKINNREGEEYAEISIPYSKMVKVSKIEAYIKDKDGLIVKKLKSGDIKD